MSVSKLKPASANPATSPALTEALVDSVITKTAAVLALLKGVVTELKNGDFC